MYIVLWLEGPLQSWGHDSKFGVRETVPFPTKSGVLGMMLAALGKGGPQRDLLSRLSHLPHQAIAYGHSVQMTDFQMIGNGYSTKGWESLFIPRKRDGSFSVGGGAKILYKKYLQEAQFAVFVEVPDDLGPEIAASLVNPVWPLCLGRKSCVPSKPVFVGTCEKECELMTVLGPIVEGKKIQFRVIEGNHPDQGEVLILNDVPICFGDHKEYESRYVTVVKEPADE